MPEPLAETIWSTLDLLSVWQAPNSILVWLNLAPAQGSFPLLGGCDTQCKEQDINKEAEGPPTSLQDSHTAQSLPFPISQLHQAHSLADFLTVSSRPNTGPRLRPYSLTFTTFYRQGKKKNLPPASLPPLRLLWMKGRAVNSTGFYLLNSPLIT